jgi:apolipoprotein N-acyltransferase
MTLVASFLSLTIGGVLLALVTRVAVPPATWLAFALLLHATRSLSVGTGFLSLLVVSFAALAVGNRGIFPMTGAPYFGVIAFCSVVMTLPFAVDRFLLGRLSGVGFTLIFPAAFVAAEFLKSRMAPAATWGSIAYTQYGYLPVMQLAALAGIWSVTFAITWFASTAEWAWSRQFDWNTVRTPLLVCGGVLGSLLLAGAVRVALAETEGRTMRVATLNRPVDLFVPGEMTRITEGRVRSGDLPQVRNKLNQLHTWFLDGSRREARAGARLIAWPEANLLVLRNDEPAFLERAKRLAADEQIYLAMGIASIQPGEPLPFENKLVIVDPSGTIVVNYLKTHPVSGWEESIMKRGDGLVPVVATPLGRLASAICFDADFPDFIRQAGQAQADLMIVVANESKAYKELHVQMAAFRAIENGMPMVRPAASGISSAIDPWGRMLAFADYFAPGDRTMTAQVPIGRARTLYPYVGDLFAWSCVVALVVSMGLVVTGRITTSVAGAHTPSPLQSISRSDAAR